jgi:hypothetical protein
MLFGEKLVRYLSYLKLKYKQNELICFFFQLPKNDSMY